MSNCINAFLEEYWLKESRNRLDNTLLKFSTIIRQIKLSQFHYFLPPSFKRLPDDSKTIESTDNQDIIKKIQGPSLQQEDKCSVKQKKEADRNDNLNPIWKLKLNEDYAKVFAGKCLTDRPKMNNNFVCLCYHIRGLCFKCYSKASAHKPIKDRQLTTYMSYYVKKCRDASN